ncbi:MAG TPA: DUF4169 family protein [Stellaceae bacterium]|nr:DUF4169 family protein [Stellaceae bacterium]
MASIVNLSRFRKNKSREDAKQRAAENRARHGRTKAERRGEEEAKRRLNELLDGKKLD